jgi:starch phosphorylase
MNEGHSAFLALERARIVMERHGLTFAEALVVTSTSNVFTTHTPVPAGNDYFKPDLIEQYLESYRKQLGLTREEFLGLGRVDPNNREEYFCMSVLAPAHRLMPTASAACMAKWRARWRDVYPGVPSARYQSARLPMEYTSLPGYPAI